MKTVLITGSSGLIGSEGVKYYCERDWKVVGIDNNFRKKFFGPEGDTSWNEEKLKTTYKNFYPIHEDITGPDIHDTLQRVKPDLVLHFAAQPAHDYSFKHPYEDFLVNCQGTVNLLEAVRLHVPESPFIFTSTSKVYGTAVNEYNLDELPTRYEYTAKWMKGVNEDCRIDQDMIHSIFGASKAAADIMVQEYGNYFGLNTVVLRPGCLTGSGHSSVELHGFLSYLIKCVITTRNYKVFGYKMKQVRDNIHSYDVITACDTIYNNLPAPGTVFNLGGEKENSISIIEAIALAEKLTGKESVFEYIDQPRTGDHIVYISDMTKFRGRYPDWQRKYNLVMIFDDIIKGYYDNSRSAHS